MNVAAINACIGIILTDSKFDQGLNFQNYEYVLPDASNPREIPHMTFSW